MTENEAKKIITDLAFDEQRVRDGEEVEALRKAVIVLEENQQYHAIGTVEECQEAIEKAEPKKVVRRSIEEGYKCPSCNSDRFWKDGCYCSDCGQKLDWD